MPGPLSDTSIETSFAVALTRSTMSAPFGLYLIALSTMLTNAGLMSTGSAWADTDGAPSVSSRCPRSSARTARWATTSSTKARTGSRVGLTTARPLSARDRNRSPSTRVVKRSASSSMLPMISRYADASRGSRKPTSPTLRIAVSGVRSSWEASAVNRWSCANASSSRCSMALKTAARRPSSSCGLSIGRRAPRRSAVIDPASDAIRSTGWSARRASWYPKAPASTTASGRPIANPASSSRSSCRTSASDRLTRTMTVSPA
jgi:hypothetical protein